ncbi:MAG TPA: amidohydrolase [Bryobacteraceae bacterium]|nr:amidohydrolase [Bryobacteraceae bacterium]
MRVHTPSRRAFLGGLGAAALSAAGQTEPDLILFNGNVLTMDAAQPHAQAVAIAGARFLAVGSNDEIRVLGRAGVRRVDLAGQTVVPGFIDAHSHPSYAGIRHLKWVDCDLRSIAEIQNAIRARAAKIPPGDWVIGFKYDDTKTKEGRKLTREDLDAAAPRNPVFIEHRGGHTAYVNSLALRRTEIPEEVADPPGGKFDRDPATGRLTGGLRENATRPFWKLLPVNFTRDEMRQGIKLISQMLVRTGITSSTECQGSPEDLLAYQDARAAGELSFRVYCFLAHEFLDRMIAAGVRTGLGDEWVRVGAIKLVADGSISERTAWLSEPYVGRPNDRGIQVAGEEELYATARKARLAGWQVGTHANGDAAIDMMLRIYERLQKEIPSSDPRYRLEHCTVVNPSLISRIRALDAIPTPFSTYVYYHGEKMREYGPERLNWMFAVRSFLDAGIRVTQASDYPPGPFEPMMALQSEVTRTDSHGNVWGPRQRVTVEEAIRVGTINGAYASFEEKIKGSITPGKLADLVVLGRDPMRVDPMTLIQIPIERTMVGGRWVYES